MHSKNRPGIHRVRYFESKILPPSQCPFDLATWTHLASRARLWASAEVARGWTFLFFGLRSFFRHATWFMPQYSPYCSVFVTADTVGGGATPRSRVGGTSGGVTNDELVKELEEVALEHVRA